MNLSIGRFLIYGVGYMEFFIDFTKGVLIGTVLYGGWKVIEYIWRNYV